MKVITDLFDRNLVKILTLFSVSPGFRFTRNEIKMKTFLNNVPLDKALTTLLNNNLVILERRFYGLNFENRYCKLLLDIIEKEYHRFKDLPLKVYFLLADMSNLFISLDIVENVYLFGSFAKLIHNEKSDVDIAFFLLRADKDINKKIKLYTSKLENKYNLVIEEHFLEKLDLGKKDPIIDSIKKDGIKLF